MRSPNVVAALLLLALAGPAGAAAPGLRVEGLRCELSVDPLGIDVARPRLSWVPVGAERGQFQSAWQVVAASSPVLLDGGKGDLWDSGKVDSDQTTEIAYGGS